MTNVELIQKIRNEIERLQKYNHCMADNAINSNMRNFYDGEEDCCKQLLSFLSTLESNEPTLTWGDVQLLDTFILECAREEREGKDWGESEEFYTEVLRRYNDFTKRTIPEIVSKIHEYNENDRKDSPEN